MSHMIQIYNSADQSEEITMFMQLLSLTGMTFKLEGHQIDSLVATGYVKACQTNNLISDISDDKAVDDITLSS